jgi:hypothetical protein
VELCYIVKHLCQNFINRVNELSTGFEMGMVEESRVVRSGVNSLLYKGKLHRWTSNV